MRSINVIGLPEIGTFYREYAYRNRLGMACQDGFSCGGKIAADRCLPQDGSFLIFMRMMSGFPSLVAEPEVR